MELLGVYLIIRCAQNMLGNSLISWAVLAADVQFNNVRPLGLVPISWAFVFLGHGAERVGECEHTRGEHAT